MLISLLLTSPRFCGMFPRLFKEARFSQPPVFTFTARAWQLMIAFKVICEGGNVFGCYNNGCYFFPNMARLSTSILFCAHRNQPASHTMRKSQWCKQSQVDKSQQDYSLLTHSWLFIHTFLHACTNTHPRICI